LALKTSGRELHALKSSAFSGALLLQLRIKVPLKLGYDPLLPATYGLADVAHNMVPSRFLNDVVVFR
jgi:hypothetical protein